MVYVKRDSGGAIVAVSYGADGDFVEAVDPQSTELQTFLNTVNSGEGELTASDQDFVRVLEDVVDLLIGKGVILFTELPESAQQKILHRQRMRSELGSALDLLDGD